MGRKRKQVDSEGQAKAPLPPCRVCDAPGAGFHYGANTCEACKGFFHRSLKLSPQYKCEGDRNCLIEHGQEKLCQACRYQKCLAVGMAKAAIKTGRYTSVKRTNDILEIKRLQKGKIGQPSDKSIKNQILQSLDSGSDNSVDSNSLYGQAPADCSTSGSQNVPGMTATATCQAGQRLAGVAKESSGMAGQHFSDTKIPGLHECVESLSGCRRKRETEIASVQNLEALFNESSCSPQTQCMQQLLSPPSVPSPLSQTSPSHSPFNPCVPKSSPSLLTDVASSLLSLSMQQSEAPRAGSSVSPAASLMESSHDLSSALHSPASYASSLKSPASSTLSPASSLPIFSPCSNDMQSAGSSSGERDSVKATLYGTFCDSCGCNVSDKEKSLEELYNDKDTVARMLLEAYDNYLVPVYGNMTEEEVKQQQLEHRDACRLRREMFGPLNRLPDQEYDYIYATTGLDTDDRQKRLHKVGVALEATIRGMVKFAKVIPGFSRLDIADKVNLIKYSRQEFVLFSLSKYVNCDMKVLRGMDSQWKCEYEIVGFVHLDQGLRDLIDGHFQFNGSLQNLRLNDEEKVLIQAIIIMGPDRDPPVTSTQVRDIYWHLNECLIHTLGKRHPNPLLLYAKIIDRITEARSQTENAVQFFRKAGIAKYSDMLENPLLREMCAGILFDCNEDDVDLQR